jgi:hypothetical protein
LESKEKIDGEIKAPPSAGVHVVGLKQVFATAPATGGWRSFEKHQQNQCSARRPPIPSRQSRSDER